MPVQLHALQQQSKRELRCQHKFTFHLRMQFSFHVKHEIRNNNIIIINIRNYPRLFNTAQISILPGSSLPAERQRVWDAYFVRKLFCKLIYGNCCPSWGDGTTSCTCTTAGIANPFSDDRQLEGIKIYNGKCMNAPQEKIRNQIIWLRLRSRTCYTNWLKRKYHT